MNVRAITQSALLAALIGISASAAAQVPDNDGYLFDARGQVVRTGTGLCWKTTRWTPAMAIAECDPELAKTAAEAAKAKLAGAKPTADKITLAADALFDFNKAVLRAEGKAKLDELVAKLGGVNLELITATGHTDRIGTDKYNQKLSEKRAAAVQAYLVSKGVPAGKIVTEGKGKKQPVTGDKCKGNKKTKALIECLQPDRRVEIQLLGTQAAK